jgi:hypothetical protein
MVTGYLGKMKGESILEFAYSLKQSETENRKALAPYVEEITYENYYAKLS